jgi:hypothetical protein
MSSAAPSLDIETIIEDKRSVRLGGVKYTIIRTLDRLGLKLLLMSASGKPIGTVRFASPNTGSIWIAHECIGEFAREKNSFVVLPIRDGRKMPESKSEDDPLHFLIRAFNARTRRVLHGRHGVSAKTRT